MATLALSLAGQFAGGLVGGPVGATIGRALGALAGSAIDGALFGERPREPARADIRLTGSTEGAAIPRLYGWGRLEGNIIWATELERLAEEGAGAKGGGREEESETIAASFAVAFCEGAVQRLGRVWADGQLLDPETVTMRFYGGTETQGVDSLIAARQGDGQAPAYRGLCYIVFERLPLTGFGNRIPNISAELCRVVGDLEPQIRAVTVIPGATEFGYDPSPRVRLLGPGATGNENTHQSASLSDWTLSLDELQALCPNLERVALVVAWFGSDLRAGHCTISPKVEASDRTVTGLGWSVAGLTRGTAPVVSQFAGGPAYGGTPSDQSVRAAIADLRARGLSVTLYPIVLMDIAAGNTLPNPYTGEAGQPAHPWRGRITCDPAPGRAGSPEGSGAVETQIAQLVGGTGDWGLRRIVRHYASLAGEAGADALVIGSELVGLTTLRGDGGSYPFVAELMGLAEEARALAGPGVKLTYAADWSEYFGHQPQDGSGDRRFHLDPLWASDAIDAVGIDAYMPIADWRDGDRHADAEAWESPYDLGYLRSGIAGGEGFDWYYADPADRIAGLRTPITDAVHGEPWVWRFKDIVSWWREPHHERIGGVRSPEPTAWVPQSKPIWFTELGCAAVDRGANQPNVFGDAKSAEDGRPYFSAGTPDPLMQRQVLRAHLGHWADGTANPVSSVYGGPMVDLGHIHLWTWDARPFPAFPRDRENWADGVNHVTGHWLTGRLGGLAADELVAAIAADFGVTVNAEAARPPFIHGYRVTGPTNCRAALEPVLEATSLLLRDGPAGLASVAPSRRVVATIEREDLVAGEGAILSRRRPDPGEAVRQFALGYGDRERDYLAGTVTASRFGGGALAGEDFALVLDASGARFAAERLLLARAMSGETLRFALPEAETRLEPGDVVALSGEGEGPFEITELRDAGTRQVVARARVPLVDVAVTAERALPVAPGPAPRALPQVVAAHLPASPANPGQSRLLLAASARPWPGAVTVVDVATGERLSRLTRSASIGTLLEPAPAGPLAVWDAFGSLLIRFGSGHPTSAEDGPVLAGANRLLLQTELGWEVVGYAGAELVAPATYRLTRLLRGLDGTDAGMAPAASGALALVLDDKVALLPMPIGWLGGSADLLAFAGPGDLDGTALDLNAGLGPALPLAPVHLSAIRDPASGDVTLGWIGRSRADPGNWALAEVPADGVPDDWRITISAEGETARVLGVTGRSALYSAADQIADFGALPAAFDFAVQQVSPVLGPGHAGQGVFHD
ncbi:Putative phage tail protein [Devosia enhydra]|uniref:Putative phage tail protein n=1 Tax=Devosia enhydra TaxID=665118 RepID=A0A1K2I0F3_9HYPH|nr:glycoside hydrolase/phage tail family protein [Devosia enhydra]SFZ85869.1 Putative phage tail protein [Devosia enhydra]